MITPQIEKVARAIAFSVGAAMVGPGQSRATREIGWRGDGGHFPLYVDRHWQEHIHAAEGAIAAMRELPEDPGPRYTSGEYSRANQSAMVDDALGIAIPRNHIGDNMSQDIVEQAKNAAQAIKDDIRGIFKSGPPEYKDYLNGILVGCATEIETLRAQLASLRQVAGAVSLESGLTFGDIKGGKYARPVQQPDGSYKMETF